MAKAAPENIVVEYTPAGFDYVRRILGQRPFDESAPVIMEMEQQRQQQRGKPEEPQAIPAEVLKAIAAAGGGAGAPNGAGGPPAASKAPP